MPSSISKFFSKVRGEIYFETDIDLVSSTQAEYDFLRFVDLNPNLYTTPVLQHALFRYETYWLPLCADHPDEILPAPLDIEWVWHCHILNPVAYANDCKQIVGKVIDHQPFCLASHDQISKSKNYWTQKYLSIEYEMKMENVDSISKTSEYHRKSSYDIVSAAQRQRIFNYNTSLRHYRDAKFLKEALKRYKIMLKIKRNNPDVFIVPCYDNDLIWHTHQQFVSLYERDTLTILGKTLDHDDSTSDRSPGSHLDQSSATTKKLWAKHRKSFGVAGAFYRGEPPMPLNMDQSRFRSLVVGEEYSFTTHEITRTMMEANHLKDVLHHTPLMSPNSLHKEAAQCQYSDNILKSANGQNAFTWRIVHCRNPVLSALEILDLYGNVVATAHTIGQESCPERKQISHTLSNYHHERYVERSMLIRSTEGDFAILKSSWQGFRKRRSPGNLKLELFHVNGCNSGWMQVNSVSSKQASFEWTAPGIKSASWQRGSVDIETGDIKFSGNVERVGEFIAIGCAIAVSYVLSQPRPPPPKDGAYPEPDSKKPNVMHIDKMDMLVAGGLYSNSLPRWYHSRCVGDYFYQVHPSFHNCDFDFDNFSGDGDVDVFDNCGHDVGEDWGCDDNDPSACGGCGGGGDGGGFWSGGDGGGFWSGGDGGGDGGGGSCGGGDSGGGGGCGGGCGGD